MVFAFAALCALSIHADAAILPGARVALYDISPRSGLESGAEVYPSLRALAECAAESVRYGRMGAYAPESMRGAPVPPWSQAVAIQSRVVSVAGVPAEAFEVEFTAGTLRHRRAWVLGPSVHVDTRPLLGIDR
jgi:hypothetical protein